MGIMINRIIKATLFFALALMLALPAQARKKQGYEITLSINHGKDTMMFMGHYFAKGNSIIDTALRDRKGRFVFESKTDTLAPGLYFFANPEGKYVEFVVYHEPPFFNFVTDEEDWTTNMKVKGSPENDFFYRFHRIDADYAKDLDDKYFSMDSVEFMAYKRKRLLSLDSVKIGMIEENPSRFLSKMMLATKEVYPPIVDEKGDTLSEAQRRDYYLEHYFDNIALEDDAIIRTPKKVFYDQVMSLYNEYLKYAPPSVIEHSIDIMMERAKKAPTVFQYLTLTLTQKYLQSNVMVYDEVYVHMVQNYFASDYNFWSTPSNIEQELMRATKWERLLVGKEAPELILFDTLHNPHSLHALPYKWKLLVFWSPNCGHCKHIIPTVYQVFEKYQAKYDIGAFTILSDPDDKTRAEWRKFMKDHNMTSPTWLSLDGGEANVDWHDVYDITTTPQIYLIDEDNIIQAKHLGESSVEKVIQAICGNGNNE